jgi:hypothetical protein
MQGKRFHLILESSYIHMHWQDPSCEGAHLAPGQVKEGIVVGKPLCLRAGGLRVPWSEGIRQLRGSLMMETEPEQAC